jgi:ribosomal protein S18 acetylase RimI-like enzyme
MFKSFWLTGRNQTVEIVLIEEQDLPVLAELFQQFWNEESNLEKMQAKFSKLVENPAYILLGAKNAGRLVGFAMGIICEELYGECEPFMVIEDVIVDKNQRRYGVGEALMSTLEKHAVERNCCQIIFITETNRAETIRFYASLGYDPDSHTGFKKRLG